MNFEEIVEAANSWLQSHNEFQLIMSDETESRLQFTSSIPHLVSFHVICPDQGNWVVGSDIDSVIPHLMGARTYCQTCPEKKIREVLECLSKETGKGCQNPGGSRNNELDADDDDGDDDDDEDDDPDYYDYGDDDDGLEEKGGASSKSEPLSEKCSEEDEFERFARESNSLAVSRLVKDMRNLQQSSGKFGITGSPRGDNLFIWDVNLTDFPEKSKLTKDLEAYAKRYNRKASIDLEMVFPQDYPMSPPFVRIIRPRFKFLTGHITIGGSICMEALTKSGWTPSNDIESILVQIRATIMSDENTSLAGNANVDYTESEAKDAFRRMVDRYGWNK